MNRLPAVLILALPTLAMAAPRFAVVAGSNTGGAGRPHLWYAEKDAERFQAALRELGDFPPERVALLRGPKIDSFRDALAVTEAKIAAAHARGEKPLLIVYYSGHAGPGGLEFGADTMSYDELKGLVAASKAEAKVVIVDACEAGALTQVKSAQVIPTIDFPLPEDDVEGTAYIASTAVGEAAQESAQLEGSFFTHHLDVAMRGAGDADGDGLVTLAEAFRYTAARTISTTAETSVGPQHPTYEFKMSGHGDVVLSDLRRAEAHLRVPADPGALYVLRGPHSLVAEVQAGTAELRLAVPAGVYQLERRARNGRARGAMTVAAGDDRALPVLEPTRYEQARTKGGPKPGEAFAGFGVALIPMPHGGAAPAIRGGFRHELGPVGMVLSLEYAFGNVRDTHRRYSYSRVGGDAAFLLPIAGGERLLEGGVSVGYGYATQTWNDHRSFSAGDASAGLLLRWSLPLGRMRAAVDVSAGGRLFRLDRRQVLRPAASSTLVLLYGF